MPSGQARNLYIAHTAYRKVIKNHSHQILSIMADVIHNEGIRGSIVNRRDDEEKFELLQECNDIMLEKINANIDKLSRVKMADKIETYSNLVSETKKALSGSWNQEIDKSTKVHAVQILNTQNIERPQATFKTPVDNSMTPFYPRLHCKPNSIKQLAVLPEYNHEGEIISYLHPYEMEIEKFKPSEARLVVAQPIPPTKIETADLVYIDDFASLKASLTELMNVSELAVDVEHHSYRTFQGITCLLQVSTRTKDYIFDTIALRDDLHILNEVFTNPAILKVFHGAKLDIQWLQRDLSIYVVNMFDTFEAARRLGFARLSLAYLLKRYCGIDADKTFQLADWRMRPLAEELIEYARQDTHYLLFIYDHLRNDLINSNNFNTNVLKSVYQSSADVCKQKYCKPVIDSYSFMDIYRKSRKLFDNRQLYALKELFLWRDRVAREEDESYGYVLPNHMMLQIAESLPREMQGILACCNPIPPFVKQNLVILHRFILRAREQSLEKVVTEQPLSSNRESQISHYCDHDNPFYCPHELGKHEDENAQLPCLLSDPSALANSVKTMISVTEPQLKIFLDDNFLVKTDHAKVEDTSSSPPFITPYQRYKAYLPIAHRSKEKREKASMKKPLCPDEVPPQKSIKHTLKADSEENNDTEKSVILKMGSFRKPQKHRLDEPISTNYTIQIFSSSNGEIKVDQQQVILEKTIVDLARSRQNNSPQGNPSEKKFQANSKPKLNLNKTKILRRNKQIKEKSAKKLNQEIKRFNKMNQPQRAIKTLKSLSTIDFSRFEGGSKASQMKQFEIQQRFNSKRQNNSRQHRGNFSK